MAGSEGSDADQLASRQIELEAPLDVPGSLGGLARWGDDLMDRWDGVRWLRVVRLGDRAVPARVRSIGSLERPVLEVQASDGDLDVVAARFARGFVQAPEHLARLVAVDSVVAAADARFPGVRPVLTLDPLTALVRSISAQQVNLCWAAEIRRRLAEGYGIRHRIGDEVVFELDATALADASVEDLRRLQLTTAKATSVIAVASAVVDGRVSLQALEPLPDEEIVVALTGIYGIGRWSAEWFLARTLGRPRVVAGDLGVRKAIGQGYFHGRMPSESEVRAATAHWGAAAGVAQQLLLNTLLNPGRSDPRAP
jgi:DNA-3-methyladenine glycosylase II